MNETDTNKIETNQKKDRDYLFDNLKATLIFSVVIAHYFRVSGSFAVPTFGGIVYMISFSYIMQGFLFVSGYFSRNLDKCRRTSFQNFLFPYLVLMPVMFCIRYLLFGHAHLDFTLPTMALWYLLTLFVYRFLMKDLVRIKYILPISIVVSLTAGFISSLDSTLSLGRTFSFLPFFLLGYYFKEDWIEKLRKIPKALAILLLAALIGLTAYSALHRIIPLSALYMKSSYASTGLTGGQGVAVRIVISLLSIAWIFVFINLLPRGRTFLSLIGQNTMEVYVLHIAIRYVVKRFGGFFGQDVLSYLALILIAVMAVWIFSRPAVARKYNAFFDFLYRWIITIPGTLIRRIL